MYKIFVGLFVGFVGLQGVQGLGNGLYTPSEDVSDASTVDLDIQLIEELLDVGNFSGALYVYQNGRPTGDPNSNYKILQKFSTEIAEYAVELNKNDLLLEYLDFVSYYNNKTYADKFITDALKGEGEFAGLDDAPRAELAVKGIQYQSVFMFLLREMYESVNKCIENEGPDIGEWDEGVAFYIGSLVDSSEIGYLQYALAEKRAPAFGVNTNERAISAFNVGQGYIRDNDCAKASAQLYESRKAMQIALFQGIIQYSMKSDPSFTANPSHKARAELWAFTAGVLPYINNVDKVAAATIKSNAQYNTQTAAQDSIVNAEEVAKYVYKVLPKLCISCDELGTVSLNGVTLSTGCTTDKEQLDLSCAALALEADSNVSNPSSGLSTGAIIGLIVCGLAIVVIFVGVAIFLAKSNPQKNTKTEDISEPNSAGQIATEDDDAHVTEV